MPVLIDIATLRTALFAVGFLGLGLISSLAQAQIQAGRAANGSLLITDQPLPNGVNASPLELDQIMTLPPAAKTATKSSPTEKPAEVNPQANKQTTEEAATCRSIKKRYNETKITLENTERDKASGKLLIPDSGLVTMRQNLATLERLQALCQP
jgi:hypothetical protein